MAGAHHQLGTSLLHNNRGLPYKFPTTHNDIARQAPETVGRLAAGVRPILHPAAARLMCDFLVFKRANGTDSERRLYRNMTTTQLVTRLLSVRPLMFMGPEDSWLMKDGRRGHGWKAAESSYTALKNMLTYDEICLGALVGVSVPTRFINSGNRHNMARPGPPGSMEAEGVYVGLVGARFERRGVMEWAHCVVDALCTAENGYGPDATEKGLLGVWANFYGSALSGPYFPTLDQAKEAQQQGGPYVDVGAGRLLNAACYRHRMRMVIEPFLLDANERAGMQQRQAYVHVVGLGLGVWNLHPSQASLMVSVYADLLATLPLPSIADIYFSYFPEDSHGALGEGQGTPRDWTVDGTHTNRVVVHFGTRDPADVLSGPDQGKLLVALYAWDANAYPGNEFWAGMLSASGDPAAACCSNISWLQNPDVNPTRVCGDAAVVLGEGMSMGLKEYDRLHLHT